MKAFGGIVLCAFMAVFSQGARATDGLCRWEGGPGTSLSCKMEDCPKDGGAAICSQLEIKKPSVGKNSEGYLYSVCDGLNYVPNDARWCRAAGGEWGTDPYGQGACYSMPEHVVGGAGTLFDEESLVETVPDKKIGNPTCDGLTIDDTGWGKGSTTDDRCWNQQPQYINGLNIFDRRERTYSGKVKDSNGACSVPWSGTIIIARGRDVQCPLGYAARYRPDRDIDCVRPTPCCSKVGDPVEASSGARVMREEDYRFATHDGLSLVRFYYSYGYYRPQGSPQSAVPRGDDFWRTNYDVRLYPEQGEGALLASVTFPDGRVSTFDTGGHPQPSASDDLVRLRGFATGWVLERDDGQNLLFDLSGRLTSLVDRNGLSTVLAYDQAGNLGIVEDPYGRSLVFSYDGTHLASVTTPDGETIHFSEDSAGNTSKVTYADGTSRAYEYSDPRYPHLLTKLIDEAGNASQFEYDPLGRAARNVLANGTDETFSYSSNSTTFKDGAGKTQSIKFETSGGVSRPVSISTACAGCIETVRSRSYDDTGNLVGVTDAAGHVSSFTYVGGTSLERVRTEALNVDGSDTPATRRTVTTWDASLRKPTGILHQATGEPDWSEAMEYDSRGNLLSEERSSGLIKRRTTYSYDANGHVLSIDGPRTDIADVSSMTYYAANDPCLGCRGQLKTFTDALGHVTTYSQYDSNGNLLVIVDPNNVVTQTKYDVRGRIISTTAAYGSAYAEETHHTYDGAGRVSATRAANGSRSTYAYDAANRIVSAIGGDGSEVQFVRDPNGYVVKRSVRTQAGVLDLSDERIVDRQGRVSASIDGYGEKTVFEYDENGNQTGIITPLGFQSSSQFDGLGRLIRAVSPDGGATQISYNSRDQVTSYVDSNGHTTTFTYDGLGDLISSASPDKGVTTYGHDNAGNVTETLDARKVRSTMSYDALDRIVERVEGVGRQDSNVTSWEYDSAPNGAGRLTSVTSNKTKTAFEYDPLGRITLNVQTLSANAERRASYRYSKGHLVEIVYPSGMVVDYAYDTGGRVASVTANGIAVMKNPSYGAFGRLVSYEAAPGQVISRTFDLNGRLSESTSGPQTAPGSYAFDYDASSRLTEALMANSGRFAFGYDLNGNRVFGSEDGARSIYTYSPTSNQLLSVGLDSSTSIRHLSYDATGSVVENGPWRYTYDNGGKLQSADGPTSVVYLVDGMGRRVSAASSSESTSYFYGLSNELLGHYSNRAAKDYETIFLNGIPIAIVSLGGAASASYYVAYTDQIGAVRRLANRNGSVVWAWDGEPFGSKAPESPNGSYDLIYAGRFPGQVVDESTGLFYNLNRDYDPSIGRYLQTDPIGLLGGPNSYTYVENNPITRFDLDGKKWIANSPHDSVYPTIECDGMGGIRVFIGNLFTSRQLICLKDCVVAHEKVHLEDAAQDSPCYLKDAGLQVYNPSVVITDTSEVKAYKTSLACLRAKLKAEKSKQCPECESTLETEIANEEDLLGRYEYRLKTSGGSK